MSKRKRSVDLIAIYEAVLDGRLDIWVDQNGLINVENRRSGRLIVVPTTKDMDGVEDREECDAWDNRR